MFFFFLAITFNHEDLNKIFKYLDDPNPLSIPQTNGKLFKTSFLIIILIINIIININHGSVVIVYTILISSVVIVVSYIVVIIVSSIVFSRIAIIVPIILVVFVLIFAVNPIIFSFIGCLFSCSATGRSSV